MVIKLGNDEALIVRESLELERNIMKLSMREYVREIKLFEKKHKMKTKQFIEKFNSGELGDEGEWFDWLFVYKASQHIKERLNTIDSIVT